MNEDYEKERSGPDRVIDEEEELNEALFKRRPVQAKKVDYVGVWFVTLGLFFSAVALWGILAPMVGRWFAPPAGQRAGGKQEAFVALAYEGISRNGKEVTPERFREHLETMRKAGYVPIRLEDVEALLFEGRLLPEFAVLVTMDQSRKSSHFNATPILRRLGWNAVMFLWTRPIVEKDPAALLWPYLRSMARSGVWEFGAQSHDGFRRVTTSPKGALGGFMTSPVWFPDQERYEEPSEFVQRLIADHDLCRSKVQRHLRITPQAYAYPYGDFGQFQRRTGVARPINLRLARERYRLAFTLGNLAVNTRYSDPRRLNRLLVDPEWSGLELVERLERAWPRPDPSLMRGGDLLVEAWIPDWGQLEQTASGDLVLEPSAGATGATTWLAGSDLMVNAAFRIRFRLDAGQLALYLRASADGESFVCLNLGQPPEDSEFPPQDRDPAASGGAWLSQKRSGQARFTLASSDVAVPLGVDHELEVFLRDRFLSAYLNGQELFTTRTPLRSDPEPGLVGLSVWSPQVGSARAVMTHVDIRAMTPTVALWTPDPAQEAHVSSWVSRNASRLSVLSPRWVDFGIPRTRHSEGMDLAFFQKLARVNRLDLHPRIVIADQSELRWMTPSLLAERVAREQLDGVLLDLTRWNRRAEPVLASWLHAGSAALAKQGARLTVHLPSWYETPASLSSLLSVLPGARVVVQDPDAGNHRAQGLAEDRLVRLESVPAPPEDEPLPASYLIPSEWIGRAEAAETVEEQGDRMEQEGLVAFREGRPDRAFEVWSAWSRLLPGNPRAHMLMGDALARQEDAQGAVWEYERSLDLDPGQIPLATRLADFHVTMGHPDKARDLLNVYARLFPGEEQVLKAQASWLSRNGQEAEALKMVLDLLERNPLDAESIVLGLRLTSVKEERAFLMDRLVQAGGNPRQHLALGQAVWAHALTAHSGGEALHALVERIATSPSSSRVAEVFGRIRQNGTPVRDDLRSGLFSAERWWIEGAELKPVPDGGRALHASDRNTEGWMRLLGSLRLRHSFAEATIGRTRGSFWLLLCRTPDHLVRFGSADDGYLRLQTWSNKRLTGERRIPFERSSAPLHLRVQARGHGVMAFAGPPGTEEISLSLPLPEEMVYGWAGMAVHADEKGSASAELLRVGAGALPTRLGLIQPMLGESQQETQLRSLRPHAPSLMALSPGGNRIDAGGVWVSDPGANQEMYRMFARYHRLWVVPSVVSESPRTVDPVMLEEKAQSMRVDGLLLLLTAWPGDDWMESLRRALADSDLRLLVVSREPVEDGTLRLEAAGRGQEFFSRGERSFRNVRRISADRLDVGVADPEPLLIDY